MIVFYDLTKSQQDWVQAKYPKLDIAFKSGLLTSRNLPNQKTEILSVHSNCKITASMLEKLPNLKLIATRTTGVDHIDLAACKKARVRVVNAAGKNAQSVSEFTIGLILTAARQIMVGAQRVEKGRFEDDGLVGTELLGKTIGVIGTGAIGGGVLRIAKGFGMKLIAHDECKNTELKKELKFQYVPLKEIFEKADIISLHVPGTPQTKHLINERSVKSMKPTAGIVNTSRGSVVDSQAILTALKTNKLAWYAADVLEVEQNIFSDRALGKIDKQLVAHERTVITPHMAHGTEEAVSRVMAQTIDQITAFKKNKPVNFVV